MSSAWVFQAHTAKKKLGDKAPWSVGWMTPEGKRKSKKVGSKSLAEKFARRIEGELAAGTYDDTRRKQWADFRAEYEATILAKHSAANRESAQIALNHFERLVSPRLVSAIKKLTIDEYAAKRRRERGKNRNSTVSPATVNRELRHIRAVLTVAHDWKYLPEVPKVSMEREPEKLPTFVPQQDFTAIYEACDVAKFPRRIPYPAADWWRALLVFCYMTGWRIGEPLALRRDDLDLQAGTAVTRARDNKGKRDDVVPLHPIVIEHLRQIPCFEPKVFPWYHHRKTLWDQFKAIQTAAGIHLPCREPHEHTESCHLYGFHDLRRAFATLNAENMTADALQRLMRHRSYSTTQRYVNLAHQVTQAVENLRVPDVVAKRVAM
jgi:integrase